MVFPSKENPPFLTGNDENDIGILPIETWGRLNTAEETAMDLRMDLLFMRIISLLLR